MMPSMRKTVLIFCTFLTWLLISFGTCSAQTNVDKSTKHYSDFWGGFQFDLRLSRRWGLIGEGELRRKDFMAEPNVYLADVGAQYHFFKGLNAHFAIGKQWSMYHENASWLSVNAKFMQVQVVYQQFAGRFKFRERVRNEFRWLDRRSGDPTPGKEFHDRIRLLAGMEVQVFNNKMLPGLYIYDEFLAETINGLSHPAFNQNRVYMGIRQQITKTLKADLGYMNVFLKAGMPPVTELHDVLRVVLSWSPDPFRKHDSKHVSDHPASDTN
jgi:hypothetical protein